MKKLLKRFRDWMEDGLRNICGRLTPDKRVITIVVLMVVFAVVNFYVTFRAIYNIGREDSRNEQLKITPIAVPDFEFELSEPSELQHGFEAFFEKHFNSEENDTTDIRQEETEP